MTIDKILVHQARDSRSGVRLALAARLARSHGAKLAAFYEGTDGSEDAEAAFRRTIAAEGIEGEWAVAHGSLDELVNREARYCDLVVVGQSGGPEAPSHDPELPGHLVLASGRPVMIVPYAGDFETVGKRVLVGWDGTREAIRAVYDSKAILKQADQVILYQINPPKDEIDSSTRMAEHLVEIGVKAEAHHTHQAIPVDETAVFGRHTLDNGALLISATTDFNSDLLVLGAYGHSRIRELVLGGATRSVLRHMTTPVLMAH